jgi:hypothetical protein
LYPPQPIITTYPTPPAPPAVTTTTRPHGPVQVQYGSGPVQPAALQPRPVPPLAPPPPTEGSSQANQYAEFLVLPGPQRLFGILESEAASRERMINRAKETNPGERLEFPSSPELSRGKYAGRNWPEGKTFAEPNYVCYQRLLFEQKNFERYGWDLGPITPVVSTVAFWADCALLPYHLGTDPFRNYECSAGYCMPGDPVPLLLYPPEFSATGLLAEAAAVGALVVIFP